MAQLSIGGGRLVVLVGADRTVALHRWHGGRSGGDGGGGAFTFSATQGEGGWSAIEADPMPPRWEGGGGSGAST